MVDRQGSQRAPAHPGGLALKPRRALQDDEKKWCDADEKALQHCAGRFQEAQVQVRIIRSRTPGKRLLGGRIVWEAAEIIGVQTATQFAGSGCAYPTAGSATLVGNRSSLEEAGGTNGQTALQVTNNGATSTQAVAGSAVFGLFGHCPDILRCMTRGPRPRASAKSPRKLMALAALALASVDARRARRTGHTPRGISLESAAACLICRTAEPHRPVGWPCKWVFRARGAARDARYRTRPIEFLVQPRCSR